MRAFATNSSGCRFKLRGVSLFSLFSRRARVRQKASTSTFNFKRWRTSRWITAVTLVQNIQSVTQERVVEGGPVNTVCGRRHVILDTSGTPSRGVSSFVCETVVIWGTNNKTNLTSSPEIKCRQQDYKTMGELEKLEMSESDYTKRAKVKE